MNSKNFALVNASNRDVAVDAAFSFSIAERIAYLKKFGTNCNAFASFQPGMQYFDVHDVGYVSYRSAFGLVFALSDPICKAENMERLVAQFMARFPNALWVQITPELAKHIAEKHGFYCTQLGSENKVPLSTWTMAGKERQSLRKTVNQARTQGITIAEEGYIGTVGPAHDELMEASEAWLKTRVVKKELKFLVRPMEMDYRENCRYFYARKDGHVVGYVCFDPIYRDGKVVAYAPNVSRSWAGFKRGLWYSVMIHAMNLMKEEGVEYIDFGLFPARVHKEMESFESPMIHKLMDFIYNKCGWLYSCKGLDFAKSRFDGKFTKTFLAHRSRLPLFGIFAILRSSGVI
jgi:lysylphosphatidylglycerol synthetase-like protein (DUF2156 family)